VIRVMTVWSSCECTVSGGKEALTPLTKILRMPLRTPVTPGSCLLLTGLLIACSMHERLVYMTLDWRVGRTAAAAVAAA